MANRPKNITKQVEIKKVVGFFTWGMLRPSEAAARCYGFQSLKDACEFWTQNKEAFRPHLQWGDQMETINSAVNDLIEHGGA
ncbi:MAG: hypothetical protein ABIL06_09755 [Pseudomonadota bacterium]